MKGFFFLLAAILSFVVNGVFFDFGFGFFLASTRPAASASSSAGGARTGILRLFFLGGIESGDGEDAEDLAAARSRSWAAFAMWPAVVSVLNLDCLEVGDIFRFSFGLCKKVFLDVL